METHALQFKNKRDPERFEQAQRDIAGLIAQAQAGTIELAYVDETGFAPQPPNRSAWTKGGETHAVTAKRAQRLNVIGAMLQRVSKPLVVILDNASIHTAKKLKPYWELLEEKGMRH